MMAKNIRMKISSMVSEQAEGPGDQGTRGRRAEEPPLRPPAPAAPCVLPSPPGAAQDAEMMLELTEAEK